jgi:hypothetical protein
MERTAREPIPDAERTESGWQRDYGPAEPEPKDYEELSAPELTEGPPVPLDTDDLDPALRSADIEAGIELGIRIHAALAQVTAERPTVPPGTLAPEEQEAVNRFLAAPGCARSSFAPAGS